MNLYNDLLVDKGNCRFRIVHWLLRLVVDSFLIKLIINQTWVKRNLKSWMDSFLGKITKCDQNSLDAVFIRKNSN